MTHQAPTHYDDVVGVEVTIDGMLVIADRLHLMDFPVALGIRLNIPQEELRNIVWEQVARDLTAQGVLDIFGEPHPEVAAMVDTLSRADRTLEGRWWRRDVGGKMVRFVVCRKDTRIFWAAPVWWSTTSCRASRTSTSPIWCSSSSVTCPLVASSSFPGTSTSRPAPRSNSTCSVAPSSGGSSSWRPRCPTTSTGSNGVDLHRRSSIHVEHHARPVVDHTSDNPDRPADDRSGVACGGADRDLYRRNRVGVGRSHGGHAQGRVGRVRLLGAGDLGVRAAGGAAAQG